MSNKNTYCLCQVSQVQQCTRRAPRTQHKVMLTALICCRGRIQIKSSKGKRHMGEVEENQAQAAKGPTPVDSHGTCLSLSAVSGDHTFETLPTREAH